MVNADLRPFSPFVLPWIAKFMVFLWPRSAGTPKQEYLKEGTK